MSLLSHLINLDQKVIIFKNRIDQSLLNSGVFYTFVSSLVPYKTNLSGLLDSLSIKLEQIYNINHLLVFSQYQHIGRNIDRNKVWCI